MQKLQKLMGGKRRMKVSNFIPSDPQYINVSRSMKNSPVEFRTRRSVINRNNYKLLTENENLTPFGILGKYLSKMTKTIKNKDPNTSYVVLPKTNDTEDNFILKVGFWRN